MIQPEKFRIEVKAGDIILINTRLWFHETELPCSRTARDQISFSYARDFHIAAEGEQVVFPEPDMCNEEGPVVSRALKAGEIVLREKPSHVIQGIDNRKDFLSCANCYGMVGTPALHIAVATKQLSRAVLLSSSLSPEDRAVLQQLALPHLSDPRLNSDSSDTKIASDGKVKKKAGSTERAERDDTRKPLTKKRKQRGEPSRDGSSARTKSDATSRDHKDDRECSQTSQQEEEELEALPWVAKSDAPVMHERLTFRNQLIAVLQVSCSRGGSELFCSAECEAASLIASRRLLRCCHKMEIYAFHLFFSSS